MSLAQFVSEEPLRREIRTKILSALDDLEYLRSFIAGLQEGCDIDAGDFNCMNARSLLGIAEGQLIRYILQQIISTNEILPQHPTREEINAIERIAWIPLSC